MDSFSIGWCIFVGIMVLVATFTYVHNPPDDIHTYRQGKQRRKEYNIRIEAFLQDAPSGPRVKTSKAYEKEKVCGADVVTDTGTRSCPFESTDGIQPETGKDFRHDCCASCNHAARGQVRRESIPCVIKKLGVGQRKDNHEGFYKVLLTIRQCLFSEERG